MINGKWFDTEFERLELIHNSMQEDREVFCQKVEKEIVPYLFWQSTPPGELPDPHQALEKLSFTDWFTEAVRYERINDDTVKTAEKILKRLYEQRGMEFSEYKEDQISKLEKSIRGYNRQAEMFIGINHVVQIMLVVGAVIVPFIINITAIPKIFSTIISALVAVIAAITNLMKFTVRSSVYWDTAEQIKKQYELFQRKTEPYTNSSKEGAALDLLIEEIGKIKINLKKKLSDLDRRPSPTQASSEYSEHNRLTELS